MRALNLCSFCQLSALLSALFGRRRFGSLRSPSVSRVLWLGTTCTLAVTGHRSSLYRQHLHSAPRTGRTRSRTICFAGAMQSRAHIYNRTAADLLPTIDALAAGNPRPRVLELPRRYVVLHSTCIRAPCDARLCGVQGASRVSPPPSLLPAHRATTYPLSVTTAPGASQVRA